MHKHAADINMTWYWFILPWNRTCALTNSSDKNNTTGRVFSWLLLASSATICLFKLQVQVQELRIIASSLHSEHGGKYMRTFILIFWHWKAR